MGPGGRARDAAQESNSAVNELPSKCTNLRADLVRVCWAAPWEICFGIVLIWFKGLWSLVLAHLAHQPRNRGVGGGGKCRGKGKVHTQSAGARFSDMSTKQDVASPAACYKWLPYNVTGDNRSNVTPN